MGDADHFSRSTDRDILSDEDGVKSRENEKEVITTAAQSSSSQQVELKAKKIPRGKSYRKNNRRQALVSAEDRPGIVSAAKHEAQFCICVNLYVDYLLVRAVKELVLDPPSREKVQKESDLPSDDNQTGTCMHGCECEPIFTATDDSYLDLICEEIHSTLPCSERRDGFDQEKGDRVTGSMRQKDGGVHENIVDVSPPLLSSMEEEIDFEMAADDYMNTSFPDNDLMEDEYDSAEDVFEDVPSIIQPDASETTGQRPKQPNNSNTRRRKYEFEVDCETGMVFSFEIVEPGENGSGDEYEYEDCDECDDCDGRDSAELENIDGESNICLVEFEPDDDSSLFRVIDERDDVEETVYTVVDEDGSDNKLARKTSDFRSRSPKKLPRAIRDGTDSHRRRCYSTGDTERLESLESSSSEFYSHADILDRILTLPSPPKSSPGSYEVDDSEEDLSSSQEELEGILDPPCQRNHPGKNVNVALRGVISDTTNAFHDDLVTTESKSNQESQNDNDHHSDPQSEDERRWQDLRFKHQIKLGKLDLDNPYHGEVSYNTNHRTTEVHPAADIPFERCPEMQKHSSGAWDETDTSTLKDTPPLNPGREEEVTQADEDETISTRYQLTQRCGVPLSDGCLEEVTQLVEQQSDADENLFEYIRNRRGRLCRREVNELLTDLAREQEAMDRMLRDAHRAQEEFVQLKKGVQNLLERLESCQPA